jgi:hypothetical protein
MQPIKDLYKAKPRPDTTPSLVPAFKSKYREMVEAYVFTDTIRSYFESILERVVIDSGQGFWIQAEYGAGKTHFLVTLAALLAYMQDKALWDSVQDEPIRLFRQRLGKSRLFPLVLSLRGEGASDEYHARSLMDVILEKFQLSIDDAGLAEKIQLTAAQDILNWLDSVKTSQAIRTEASEFIQKKCGKSIETFRKENSDQALAQLLNQYFVEANIQPRDIPVSVRDRLKYIYDQLKDAGYTGLMVVIDEYEGWQKVHNSTEELGRDADLLETLGFILPRDMGLAVFTIVASQSDIPTKLQGSGTGDRFIPMPLLALANQRDYDVIISRRTRDLVKDRDPELMEHYRFWSGQFDFARGLSEDEFRDVFPFQPRCFEAIRRITARDLPTARSGLTVFWEVINDSELAKGSDLIRLADMVRSNHLVEECLTKSIYRESYTIYKDASEAIPQLGLDEEDESLAQELLSTLYLWYAAFLEQARPLTFHELAEATLTIQFSDGIRPEDRVALVLANYSMPQVQVEGDTAIFKIGSDERAPLIKFNDYKHRALKDTYQLQSVITTSLFLKPSDTGGAGGLFADLVLDSETSKRLNSRNIEYGGKVIIVSSWRMDAGLDIREDDTHFRMIMLTPSAIANISPADLQDPRIAVVKPGDLTDEIREASASFAAWSKMNEEYHNQTGKQAEEIRSWLDTQKSRMYSDLVSMHIKLYQTGQVITRDNLGISAREAFGQGGSNNDTRFGFIIDLLLKNAYTHLPLDAGKLRVPLTPSDAGKIFDGYFNTKNAKTADTNATRNYGVPLGLSHTDAPTRFAPQNVRAFEVIEEMLKEQEGDLPAWKIFQRLSRQPYGLPYAVIQLLLLAFVRNRSPRMELTLKPRHDLQTRAAKAITQNRLTSATVAELAWKPNIQDKFDSLVPGVGPSWNDTLVYAQSILDELRPAHDQADIEAQTVRLLNELESLKNKLATLHSGIEGLAGELGERVPVSTGKILESLISFTSGMFGSFADFHEAAEATFESRPENLRDAMQSYRKLTELNSLAADIINTRNYLLNADAPASDLSLVNARNSLLGQILLAELVSAPERWNQLRPEFFSFRNRYRTVYQKHHRDYYQAVGRLQKKLADIPTQLKALEILNQLELGKPVGSDLTGRYEQLEKSVRACLVTDISAIQVEYKPVCDQCGLAIHQIAPETEVERVFDELHDALVYKARLLASESVAKVVADSKNSKIKKVLTAAQAEDLASLILNLSPEVAKVVNDGLRKEGILTFEAGLLAELSKQHPAVEESDIPRLVKDFEVLLRKAFTQARKEHPKKKIFRMTLK